MVHAPQACTPGEMGCLMGSSLEGIQPAFARSQSALDRAKAARSRAAEVLALSAGLAERHAERAEARGAPGRAEDGREVARRMWATVERLRSCLNTSAERG